MPFAVRRKTKGTYTNKCFFFLHSCSLQQWITCQPTPNTVLTTFSQSEARSDCTQEEQRLDQTQEDPQHAQGDAEVPRSGGPTQWSLRNITTLFMQEILLPLSVKARLHGKRTYKSASPSQRRSSHERAASIPKVMLLLVPR